MRDEGVEDLRIGFETDQIVGFQKNSLCLEKGLTDRPVESFDEVTAFGVLEMGTDINNFDFRLVQRRVGQKTAGAVVFQIIDEDGEFLFAFDAECRVWT